MQVFQNAEMMLKELCMDEQIYLQELCKAFNILLIRSCRFKDHYVPNTGKIPLIVCHAQETVN